MIIFLHKYSDPWNDIVAKQNKLRYQMEHEMNKYPALKYR